jgi:hypothetical protein
MKKLAVIRTESGIHQCPYGLGITKACKNAGDSVDKMVPLEKVAPDQAEFQTEHNIAVYMLHGKGKCKFADQISDSNSVVNCDWGDSAEGVGSVSINSIPATPPYVGYAGLSVYQSYPFGEYWDQLANITGPERLNGYASLESTENDALERQIENLIQKITEEKQ